MQGLLHLKGYGTACLLQYSLVVCWGMEEREESNGSALEISRALNRELRMCFMQLPSIARDEGTVDNEENTSSMKTLSQVLDKSQLTEYGKAYIRSEYERWEQEGVTPQTRDNFVRLLSLDNDGNTGIWDIPSAKKVDFALLAQALTHYREMQPSNISLEDDSNPDPELMLIKSFLHNWVLEHGKRFRYL